MTVKGGGADNGRVAWTPMTLKNPLRGCRKLVHYLKAHEQPNTLSQQMAMFLKATTDQ